MFYDIGRYPRSKSLAGTGSPRRERVERI